MTPILNNANSIFANFPNGLLTFSLSDKEFCLDIRYVLTIFSPETNKSTKIQSSNNKEEFIRCHKENFPLINLDHLLGVNSERKNLQNYIILISSDNRKAAFYADRIVEFKTINKRNLDSLKEIGFNESQGLIDKIEYDGKTISIINFTKILELYGMYSNPIKEYIEEKDSCIYANLF